MKNIIYFRELNEIGGIESHLNYLVNKYPNDITIYYQRADAKQLARLLQVVRCVKYQGETIECDKAFFCFNREIWNNVKGKRYIVLHGDYEDMVKRNQLSKSNLPIEKDCDGYFGVSQTICDSFKRLTGIECVNIGNPFIKPTPRKILRLVYCGRLSSEKGEARIKALLKELDEQLIDYQLFVYSNIEIDYPNVVNLLTRLDVAHYLNKYNYDFLLQLSDNEGYCYSVVEALSNGLPIISTPIPVFKEIGLNEGNSITLEFDCSNVKEVVKQMTKNFDFTYEAPKDNWDKYLVKGQRKYERKQQMKIKLLRDVYDTQTGNNIPTNTVIEISSERGLTAIANGYAIAIDEPKEEKVEVAIKEPKEVKKAVKKTTKKK